MKIEVLHRSFHGKSAYAIYSGTGFKLSVYVYHNIPCTKLPGIFHLVIHMLPKNGKHVRKIFTDYLKFRQYRESLKVA